MSISDTIYESPDGGKTIYSRKINDLPKKRILLRKREDAYSRIKKWRDILNEAQDNPSLEDAIKKAEVIYELSKQR